MIRIDDFHRQVGRGVRPRRVRHRGRRGAASPAAPSLSPGTTARRAREAAIADAASRLADLSEANWATFAALVLAPGVPLTHPEPHWTVEGTRSSRRRDHRRYRDCSRASARLQRAECAVHRHHRHQRQIDDDGADRAHPSARRASTRRSAATSAGRCSRSTGRRPAGTHVIEMSSFQIDLTPTLDADRRRDAQRDARIISIATAPSRITPP